MIEILSDLKKLTELNLTLTNNKIESDYLDEVNNNLR